MYCTLIKSDAVLQVSLGLKTEEEEFYGKLAHKCSC